MPIPNPKPKTYYSDKYLTWIRERREHHNPNSEGMLYWPVEVEIINLLMKYIESLAQ